MGVSITVLAIVAAMEVFMLGYSVVNVSLYQEYLWHYRAFYLCLLLAVLVYIALNLYAKRNIAQRYKLLYVASPVYACFFFAWALGITYFDAIHFNTIDPMVFMTFSLVVPMGFFVPPYAYVLIAAVTDALMISLAINVSGSLAPLTNLCIFCVFQIVVSFSFLRMRLRLAEKILEVQQNARIDELTGFLNRRAYDEDAAQYEGKPLPSNLVFIAVDLNGLKETNDLYGHAAGDKIIVGATQCIRQSFGDKGLLYRMGGDEFVAIVRANPIELQGLNIAYNQHIQTWSRDNGMTLSTAFGYACASDYPDKSVDELAKIADKRMYADKALYYETGGRDRRRNQRAAIERLAS